jgi:hypothetical protein
MAGEPIQPLFFRHPVSAGTHLVYCLWAVYATVLMVRLARGRGRRAAVAVFGVSLVLLYAASAAYHAVPANRHGRCAGGQLGASVIRPFTRRGGRGWCEPGLRREHDRREGRGRWQRFRGSPLSLAA